MIKLLELTSFGVFAGCSTLASVGTWPELTKGITLISLLAFMVFQSYRQQTAMGKQLDKQNARLAQLVADDTDAKNRLAQALEDRPCLKGDQRIQEQKS